MRFLMMTCALGVLALGAVVSASAQPRPASDSPRQPSLFISPMGQPFRANASGARGIDLWFTAADHDYDSRISHDEFMANANAFFPLVDANQDGALTSMEDTTYWRRNAPEVVGDDPGGEPIGNVAEPPEQRRRDNGGHQVVQSNDVTVQGPHRGRQRLLRHPQ